MVCYCLIALESCRCMSDEPLFSLPIDDDLELSLLGSADADELFALIDCDRERLRRWLPWVDYEASLADSLEFIQRSQQQYMNDEGFQLGIHYQGCLAGVIGYHAVNWPNRHVEIGYWLGAAFEGQGLMTRACRALVEYAFEKLTLNRVEIQCATGNLRSRAIPERLGFTQEGIRREGEWLYDHFVDLVLYSMLAREWQIKSV
jgi:ribosomal-protein-serine acetyltransferase